MLIGAADAHSDLGETRKEWGEGGEGSEKEGSGDKPTEHGTTAERTIVTTTRPTRRSLCES